MHLKRKCCASKGRHDADIYCIFQIYVLRQNNEELHDVISPRLLPTEFGGTCGDYDFDGLEERLLSKQGYFEKMEQYGYST